jgi:hypothetical protein
MGKVLPDITDGLRGFIERQHLFFVATAPLGRAVLPGDADWATLAPHFPTRVGVRQLIVVELTRVQTSCGFGVPVYGYAGERDQLIAWATEKGVDEVEAYQTEKNQASIDGLPTALSGSQRP